MKKLIAILLTVALSVSIGIAGTAAFLTKDVGTQDNVFTVGDIDITLDETVGVYGEGGEAEKTDDGAEYTGLMPGDYVQKEVTVSNDGKTDAYVAVTVTLNNADEINEAIDEVYGDGDEGGQAMYDFIFDSWGINQNPRPGAAGVNDARGVIDGTYGLPEHVLKVDFAKTTSGSTVIGATNWFVAGKETAGQYWVDGPAAYDGYYTKNMDDYEICYTYYMMLPAGESSTLFKGLNIPAEFTNDQIKMFDDLKINVTAKAIQADNMGVAEKYMEDEYGEAKTAFEVLAGTIKAEDLEVNNNPSAPVGFQVSNDEELATAINDGETEIWLNPNTYHIPAAAKGKTLTINGTADSVIEIVPAGQGEANGQLDYNFDGSTVTFKGITIKSNNQTYAGFARLTGTYNKCTFENHYSLQRDSVFNDCTFNVSGDQYNIWTWGAPNATFTGCTFNSDGKAVMLYGTENTKLTIKNCVFNDTGVLLDLKAAIEIGNDYGKTYELIVNNTTVNGYEINDKGINTGTTLWANKNAMSQDNLNVVVDGVDVY